MPTNRSRKSDSKAAPTDRGETLTNAASTQAVRVVGIGASAGGLEALEQFFDAMPVDSGLAFAIVQHLSPDFRSMMDELLARHSRMRILHATEGMPVERNTLYLNPPRQNLSIRDGKFHLLQPNPRDYPNLPIDAFFASLAKDQAARSIAIILSGTGSDGTRGAASIMDAGGHVLVQEPESAKFESMPRSVIESGSFSATAVPRELPMLVGRLVKGMPVRQGGPDEGLVVDPETDILLQLEKRFGANFGYYKSSMVSRRLNRRANLAGLQDLANYAEVLRRDSLELERLYADLLIGVTAFFRDKSAFDALEATALPKMMPREGEPRQLRVWVPGCASGEEAYSIAIQLSEYARVRNIQLNLKVFATDLHHNSLETAATGIYSARALAELSNDVRARYFDASGDRYCVRPSLRSLVVFSQHNLIKDPPFTRLDLISCRNLLIYFDEVAQSKVLNLFHFALHKGGILFLGPSETLGPIHEEFAPLDGRWRIFQKLRNVSLEGATRLLPTLPALAKTDVLRPRRRDMPSFPRVLRSDRRYINRAYDAMLRRFAPPSILVSTTGEIVHVFGDAHTLLSWRSGLFTGRLTDAVVPSLRAAFSGVLEAALADRSTPVSITLDDKQADGSAINVTVRAEVLAEPGEDGAYVLLTVSELEAVAELPARELKLVSNPAESIQGRVEELERHLTSSEEDLQTTNEELEATNEELQSTNEELMSANEELQSTNEELHAVNEELYSVSSEHRRKIEELTALTNDMDHLLRCTDVGTIFLDADLNIRRFTPAIARAFNLLDRDVGRPIQLITARFPYPGLLTDIDKVMSTGRPIEHTVDVDEMHLLLRIFPYHVGEGTDGIVLTVIDVSRLKQAEHALELRNQELGRANESLQQFTYIVAHDLRAPLRTILNSAKWIEEDLGTAASEDVRTHCHRLMTYSARLTDMLADLMAYSRLGSNDTAVEQLQLQGLVRQIVETIDGEDRIDLKVIADVEEIAVRRAPLQLILQNLIDNALKYTDQDRVAITIKLDTAGPLLRFKVIDDGPGIPPRHHEKIFLPFRKLEHADKKPGNGMGLALVKKAVEDNGGIIEVASNAPVERGTTFTFSLAKANTATAARS